MSSDADPIVNGRPLSELKVVELKEELDRHGLSKIGNKTVLFTRLKEFLIGGPVIANEETGSESDADVPKRELRSPPANPLVAEYLAKQQVALIEAQKDAEAYRRAASGDETSPVEEKVVTRRGRRKKRSESSRGNESEESGRGSFMTRSRARAQHGHADAEPNANGKSETDLQRGDSEEPGSEKVDAEESGEEKEKMLEKKTTKRGRHSDEDEPPTKTGKIEKRTAIEIDSRVEVNTKQKGEASDNEGTASRSSERVVEDTEELLHRNSSDVGASLQPAEKPLEQALETVQADLPESEKLEEKNAKEMEESPSDAMAQGSVELEGRLQELNQNDDQRRLPNQLQESAEENEMAKETSVDPCQSPHERKGAEPSAESETSEEKAEISCQEVEPEKSCQEMEPEMSYQEIKPEKSFQEIELEKSCEEVKPEKLYQEVEPEKLCQEVQPERLCQEIEAEQPQEIQQDYTEQEQPSKYTEQDSREREQSSQELECKLEEVEQSSCISEELKPSVLENLQQPTDDVEAVERPSSSGDLVGKAESDDINQLSRESESFEQPACEVEELEQPASTSLEEEQQPSKTAAEVEVVLQPASTSVEEEEEPSKTAAEVAVVLQPSSTVEEEQQPSRTAAEVAVVLRPASAVEEEQQPSRTAAEVAVVLQPASTSVEEEQQPFKTATEVAVVLQPAFITEEAKQPSPKTETVEQSEEVSEEKFQSPCRVDDTEQIPTDLKEQPACVLEEAKQLSPVSEAMDQSAEKTEQDLEPREDEDSIQQESAVEAVETTTDEEHEVAAPEKSREETGRIADGITEKRASEEAVEESAEEVLQLEDDASLGDESDKKSENAGVDEDSGHADSASTSAAGEKVTEEERNSGVSGKNSPASVSMSPIRDAGEHGQCEVGDQQKAGAGEAYRNGRKRRWKQTSKGYSSGDEGIVKVVVREGSEEISIPTVGLDGKLNSEEVENDGEEREESVGGEASTEAKDTLEELDYEELVQHSHVADEPTKSSQEVDGEPSSKSRRTASGRHVSTSLSRSGDRSKDAKSNHQDHSIDVSDSDEKHITVDGLIRRRAVSPARYPVTAVLMIRQLIRPFTVKQLLELLSTFGTIAESGFWIDNIKSTCIVKYSTVEEALIARGRLHNVAWPASSPKILKVDFLDEEGLKKHMEESKPSVQEKRTSTESSVAPQRQGTLRVSVVIDRDREGRVVRPQSPGRSKESQVTRVVEDSTTKHERGSERFSPTVRRRTSSSEIKLKEVEKGVKTADELFRKTKTQPAIYYMPLTDAQVAERKRKKETSTETATATKKVPSSELGSSVGVKRAEGGSGSEKASLRREHARSPEVTRKRRPSPSYSPRRRR